MSNNKKVKRVLISIPEDFLKKVDTVAKKENYGRSEFIRQALREYKPMEFLK